MNSSNTSSSSSSSSAVVDSFYSHNIFNASPTKCLEHVDQDDSVLLSPITSVTTVQLDMVNKTISTRKKRSHIRNIDILLRLFRTLGGKDKLAKITKYIIDLLRLIVIHSSHNIEKKKKNNLLMNVLNNDKFLTLKKIMFDKINPKFSLVNCLTTLSFNVGLYRQFLRFGWLPFNIEKVITMIRKNFNTKNLTVNNFSEDDLALCLETYYNVTDELILLRKLGIWDNDFLYKHVSKHEALSWYYDIILSIKLKLQERNYLRNKIMELKIENYILLQQKQHIIETNPLIKEKKNILDDIDINTTSIDEIVNKQTSLRLVNIDLLRLGWDFLADTTDVFNMVTPKGTYAVLSLFSGLTGFFKLWLQNKKELEDLQIT